MTVKHWDVWYIVAETFTDQEIVPGVERAVVAAETLEQALDVALERYDGQKELINWYVFRAGVVPAAASGNDARGVQTRARSGPDPEGSRPDVVAVLEDDEDRHAAYCSPARRGRSAKPRSTVNRSSARNGHLVCRSLRRDLQLQRQRRGEP